MYTYYEDGKQKNLYSWRSNGMFYANICTNMEGSEKGNLKPKSGKSSGSQHMNTSRNA